jgi:hypothetical protein
MLQLWPGSIVLSGFCIGGCFVALLVLWRLLCGGTCCDACTLLGQLVALVAVVALVVVVFVVWHV